MELPHLYNLDVDPSERYDVAKSHPEIVRELRTLYKKQFEAISLPRSEIDKITDQK